MKEFLTTNGRGWGVAAGEVIKKGAYIVEYAGAGLGLPSPALVRVERNAGANNVSTRLLSAWRFHATLGEQAKLFSDMLSPS